MSGPLYGADDFETYTWVTVEAGGVEEEVLVDPARGPMVYQLDGTMGFLLLKKVGFRATAPDLGMYKPHSSAATKPWKSMTATEREIQLRMAAKKNRALAEWKGADFCALPSGAPPRGQAVVAWEEDVPARTEEELRAEARARAEARCAAERARPPIPWNRISVEDVTKNHAKRAKGVVYNIEFPWTAAMLVDWGPEWLTRAFHAAGTMDADVRVTKVSLDKKAKVTTGNNAGKFIFDVTYSKKGTGLHTRLFAKVPFALDGATRSDRLSSSVNKQPQELYEINAYRLLESSLPVQIPRFYYGDISNETSNWILITECIEFTTADAQNFGRPQPRKKPIAPWVIEGPYDKCMDHNLRGDPKEYYVLLITTGAKIAGMHWAGALGSWESLGANFQNLAGKGPEWFGVSMSKSSGEDPRTLKPKLDIAVNFISDVGKVLFPDYVSDELFLARFRSAIFAMNAYNGDIKYWKHSDADYIALTHPNMNVDNAYFWRNRKGKLDLGVLDWGGVGAMCLGHRLWWWVYCCDYELFSSSVREFIDACITSYQEHGGPRLSGDTMYTMVILTALEQMVGLCNAVPQIFKMCPKKEWPTIQDRYDKRISENIDGKSTLRLYLHVMNSIIRIFEEMNGESDLKTWIEAVFSGAWKLPPKPQEIVEGLLKGGGIGL